MVLDTQKAHEAGIFDVRGSIILRKNYLGKGWRVLEVRLCGVEKIWSVLEYLQGAFGGNVTGCSDNRKAWVLTGQKAKDFLVEIKPFLKNKRRVKQASFIIQRYVVRKQPGSSGFSQREIYRRIKLERDWNEILH
jgi:hypothetical protein